MGLFDGLRPRNITAGVAEYQAAPGAVLLDVRTPKEYRAGHIPGSANVPLDALDKVAEFAHNQDVPIFAYCYSGARSGQAVSMLRRMGYTQVKNIGGIAAWRGKVEQ